MSRKKATVARRLVIAYYKRQGWTSGEIRLYENSLLVDQNDSEWLEKRIDHAIKRAVKEAAHALTAAEPRGPLKANIARKYGVKL